MASRNLPAAIGATLLVACASTTTPAPTLTDAGNGPSCPLGPNRPTAASSALPSGACQANEGGNDLSCHYQATPCPEVINGAVYGYLCSCPTGTWSCAVVSQQGLCAPLPSDDGSAGDSGFPVGPGDAGHPVGPTGPTGPAQG